METLEKLREEYNNLNKKRNAIYRKIEELERQKVTNAFTVGECYVDTYYKSFKKVIALDGNVLYCIVVNNENILRDFYYLCEKSKIEHSFVIFKNRIYNCCIAPDYNCIGLPKEEQDSIPLNKLNDIEQLLIFGNHSYTSCKYCTDRKSVV